MFKRELFFIKDLENRKEAEELLKKIPAYFKEIPASSTGKYHPAYSLGEGGLYRHTRAAMLIAQELFNLYKFTDEEKDDIMIALMFHDALKQGTKDEKDGYSLHEHPLLAATFILEKSNFKRKDQIAPLIRSHMGQWTKSPYSPFILPLPETETEKFVHLCDYIASRKFLEAKLE